MGETARGTIITLITYYNYTYSFYLVAKNKLEKEMMEFKATKESQREKRRIYLEEKIREHKRERRILIQKINRNEKEIENTKVLIEFIHKFDILFPDDVYGHPKNYFDEEISKFRLQSEKSVKNIIKLT